jgi:threonine/homoserine/homoserine lactone efflux protein
VLVTLGLRSLLSARRAQPVRAGRPELPGGRRAGLRAGVLTGVANPKLAVFFVALFPQFLSRSQPVLPYALAMALVVVAVDVVWFSAVAVAVDRASMLLRPRVQARLERCSGALMVALGLRLAAEPG